MVYFKFDKLDKIVIALTFIIVSMFSIFNCFCFASEEIEPVKKGIGYFISNGFLVDDSSAFYLVYNFSQRGTYTLYTNRDVVIGFSNDIPVSGDKLNDVRIVRPNSSLTFEVKEPGTYLYLTSSAHVDIVNTNSVSVTFVPYNGFQTVISDLAYNVSPVSLWSTFEKSLPFILIVVAVAFGIYLITRMIKGLSKGKGRL